MKPRVHWDGYYWIAELDHGSWVERSDFDTWPRALDGALSLGLSAGVWTLP